MRLLDRYIIRSIYGHFALVMAALLVLLALFLFINEQGWVGVGSYGQLQGLRYVLMNLPATGLQFLPVGALIGSLLALGQLARGSELTVMRAAGVSVSRICAAVAAAALLLLPLAFAAGEWLAPQLTQLARVTRAVQRNGEISLTGQGGAWLADGGRILRTGAGGGVTVFELGPDQHLAAVSRAGSARQSPQGGWELADVAGSRFAPDAVLPAAEGGQRLDVAGGADFFSVASGNVRELSLTQLAHAIRVLAASGQDTHRQRFAFWAGVARLAALPLAMMLAVPFVLGSLRSAGAGARTMLGLALGLAWFMAQRMVESGAIAFGGNPVLLAWLPTLALALVVALLVRRASAA